MFYLAIPFFLFAVAFNLLSAAKLFREWFGEDVVLSILGLVVLIIAIGVPILVIVSVFNPSIPSVVGIIGFILEVVPAFGVIAWVSFVVNPQEAALREEEDKAREESERGHGEG